MFCSSVISSFYLKFFFYSKRCVYQPQELFIHQASTVNWSVSIYEIMLWTLDLSLTRHREKGTRWLQWEGENSTLTDGWFDSYVLPKGWTIKILLAWETLEIFLLTGISKRNIFFRKKKKNVVVFSNIHYKFISSNLTDKLKIQNNENKILT